ncbi:uncharacterized protein HD556DRAFT_1306745 [Suillus plorans]|uniref:Uncharacterized protein n=1 Tax=Suillus plorans TaxID=116603 RepID=A0A9P7DKH2_9AGAM|nr:uncharacterized protein HD556DRAFT_1306745 [Suillus plorans]KAG1797048.1 hypothetical protein HD556DRAFT_1306745 [Suillus plorans]
MSETIFPVAVRLQGLLCQFCIDRFGNWTGHENEVLRAVQHVTLSSGGHKNMWDSTISSINLAGEYVSRRLHIPMQGMVYDKDLYLQRHAFIKRSELLKMKEQILKVTEDPEDKYFCIQECWIPQDPLRVAQLTETGKVVPMNAVLLTEGDLVDVGAKIDFVIHRDRHAQTTLKCFLTCTYIMCIISTDEIEKMNLETLKIERFYLLLTATNIFLTMTKSKIDAHTENKTATEGRLSKHTRLTSTATESADNIGLDGPRTSENIESMTDGSGSKTTVDTSFRETSQEKTKEDRIVASGSSTSPLKQSNKGAQPALTVRSVVPNPTKQLIDEEEVDEFDDTLLTRLHKLLEYTNSKANIYALGRLLPTATWGQYKPVNDHSKVLCDPATGDPITIWVVRCITKMWFMKFSNPENQASLTIMPLSKTLAQQSAHLLAKFSSPVLNFTQQTSTIIRAIKWQNAKTSDGTSEPILFDAVYDARQEGLLKSYSERPLWNLTDLKPGDLVLLETKMTHYSKKQEDNKWHSRAQYEMIAISLLDIAEVPEETPQGAMQIDGLAI